MRAVAGFRAPFASSVSWGCLAEFGPGGSRAGAVPAWAPAGGR